MDKNLHHAEQLNDFYQELYYFLRSTHCLIEDSGVLNESLVMGMLHTERKLLATLKNIQGSFEQ